MKKNLLLYTILSIFVMASCKKSSDAVTPVIVPTTTANIKAPAGFTWETSRNLNFTISVTDTSFPKLASVISIYDADPNNGGLLLTKGAALSATSFKSTLYISNQITEVYIVKTSPNNTNIIQKVTIGTANVIAAIGI